jgi:hypothetical protein
MVGRITKPFVGALPAALSTPVPSISHAVKENRFWWRIFRPGKIIRPAPP